MVYGSEMSQIFQESAVSGPINNTNDQSNFEGTDISAVNPNSNNNMDPNNNQ